MQNILHNKLLQFSAESITIVIACYFAFQFLPNLPWWSVAIIAGIIAFLLNTQAKSFLTGFVAVSLLWGVLAYQLNAANGQLLAQKVSLMFNTNEIMDNLGGLNPLRLIYLTAILGGCIGGLGAMSGNYARKVFSPITAKEATPVE